MRDDLAAVLLGRSRRLEVDEEHRLLVGRDDDVEDVQVVEDDPALVHRLHRPLDRRVDPQRPRRVRGDRVRVGVRGEKRMPFREEGVEGAPLDEVHDQEPVFTQQEPVPHLGHHPGPGDPLQRQLLPLQAHDRVGTVRGEPRVRPPLLEDDLAPVPGVGARVDPAAVREVQRLLDAVREFAHRRRVARRELRLQERRQGHPLRDLEGRRPPVRHQLARAVPYRRDQRTPLVDDEGAGEGAIADVERAVVPAEVGEDVRAFEALQEFAQLAQDLLELGLVGGVDRDELAAGVAARVLRVAQVQQVRAGDELERDAARHAVVPHDRGDAVRVRPDGRGVDLPALGRPG